MEVGLIKEGNKEVVKNDRCKNSKSNAEKRA